MYVYLFVSSKKEYILETEYREDDVNPMDLLPDATEDFQGTSPAWPDKAKQQQREKLDLI